MIDRAPIEDWLERYRRAWSSDAAEDIAGLFTRDVRYFTAPYGEPLRGIDEVRAYWVGERESGIPWTFAHEVLAQEDDLYVVRVVVRYPAGTADAQAPEEFHDLWLVRLAGDGRAGEFVEYFMRAP